MTPSKPCYHCAVNELELTVYREYFGRLKVSVAFPLSSRFWIYFPHDFPSYCSI